MKIGLEQEFFLLDENNNPIPVPRDSTLPYDECGLLVEARGEPCSNIIDAVFSLKTAIYKIENQVKNYNRINGTQLYLSDMPFMKISKETERLVRRLYSKGVVSFENLYDHKGHKNARNEMTAGIHISFTKPTSVRYIDNHNISRDVTINGIFDWYKIFRTLDIAFKEEIKSSKRVGGMYELKADGRIEYRSLPANADHDKIIEVLKNIV